MQRRKNWRRARWGTRTVAAVGLVALLLPSRGAVKPALDRPAAGEVFGPVHWFEEEWAATEIPAEMGLGRDGCL